jgi:hypothetical protein
MEQLTNVAVWNEATSECVDHIFETQLKWPNEIYTVCTVS